MFKTTNPPPKAPEYQKKAKTVWEAIKEHEFKRALYVPIEVGETVENLQAAINREGRRHGMKIRTVRRDQNLLVWCET